LPGSTGAYLQGDEVPAANPGYLGFERPSYETRTVEHDIHARIHPPAGLEYRQQVALEFASGGLRGERLHLARGQGILILGCGRCDCEASHYKREEERSRPDHFAVRWKSQR
jgi:hypothetical protein